MGNDARRGMRAAAGLLVLGLAIGAGCGGPAAPAGAERPTCRIAGRCMGGTEDFNITLTGPGLTTQQVDAVDADIHRELDKVVHTISAYEPTSEITAFNAHTSTAPFAVSEPMAGLVRFALDLGEKSAGAFDLTVAPLVKLWGFGPEGRRTKPPSEAEAQAVRPLIGWRHVSVTPRGELVKDNPRVQIDLNALGDGWAVDLVSRAIERQGVTNYLVEVGGETYGAGVKANGDRWRIGIDQPRLNAVPGKTLQGIVNLTGLAVSTSGDYRKFFKDEQGREYAHIFDPRLGAPVQRAQCSVTIVAPRCELADGLATTLFVLGPEEGIPWIRTHFPGVEALFVVGQPDGSFREFTTPGFVKRTRYEPPVKE